MAAEQVAIPDGANEVTHPALERELALAGIAYQREMLHHALASPETVGEAILSHLGIDPDLALSIDPARLLFGALDRLERDRQAILGEIEADPIRTATMRVHYATRSR